MMSSIHNFVIMSEVDEHVAMNEVNAWCYQRDRERRQQFETIDTGYAGGSKDMTCYVYAMAGNHIGYADELRKELPSFPWTSPGAVVMYDVHEYDDNSATVTRAAQP